MSVIALAGKQVQDGFLQRPALPCDPILSFLTSRRHVFENDHTVDDRGCVPSPKARRRVGGVATGTLRRQTLRAVRLAVASNTDRDCDLVPSPVASHFRAQKRQTQRNNGVVVGEVQIDQLGYLTADRANKHKR